MVSDEKIILCFRVDAHAPRVEGSGVTVCAQCGHAIVASPTTLRAVAIDATAICLECAPAAMEGQPLPELELLPGQAEEIARALRSP